MQFVSPAFIRSNAAVRRPCNHSILIGLPIPMPYDLEDTICAIATAPGGAARGIVRASGPAVLDCIARCFEPRDEIRLAYVRRPTAIRGELTLCDVGGPLHGAQTPCDLYLWPNERSYTRQPVVELHTFGSPPLLAAILDQLVHDGARPAEPGEFTMRAFLAGRIDLTQAEAVLGVIDARGKRQLDAALEQLAGGIGRPMGAAREQLLAVLAELEAGLDFVEEDIEFISPDELDAQLAAAQAMVHDTLRQMTGRADATDLPRVVLFGAPNAGKSSLFNALIAASRAGGSEIAAADSAGAIVSRHAGTTRDYLTARVTWGPFVCELVDTAGVGDAVTGSEVVTGGEIVTGGEAIAVDSESGAAPGETIESAARAMTGRMSEQADVRLLCLDVTRSPDDFQFRQVELLPNSHQIVVWTKCDAVERTIVEERLTQWPGSIGASSRTGEGVERIGPAVGAMIESASDTALGVAPTAARCRESLRAADEALGRAREIASASAGEELVAAEVRFALVELGKVVGAVYTDDILDRIFGQFCIGK